MAGKLEVFKEILIVFETAGDARVGGIVHGLCSRAAFHELLLVPCVNVA